MTKHFLNDMDKLATSLAVISGRVEESFRMAVDALLSRDAEKALEVIKRDSEIDDLEVALEEDALKILALHAPVASDLRYLIASIKINNDLERVADIAANIGARARDLCKLPHAATPENFENMVQTALDMIHESFQACVTQDADLARKVFEKDDIVDDYHRDILDLLEIKMASEASAIPALMRWANVVRAVERIGDYATNIAEDIIYMVEGEIVRHQPPLE
ncbi:MAG: phosphate signaling complex protein PhoU [Planctomycetes bacterium]|nr:phosphate signaling complex protein PhoU [Planctomycetota bacterium]